jgi:hypothetical protein
MATRYLYEGLVTVNGADPLLPAVGSALSGSTVVRPETLKAVIIQPVSGAINWRIDNDPDATYPSIAAGGLLTFTGDNIPYQAIKGYAGSNTTVYVAWG